MYGYIISEQSDYFLLTPKMSASDGVGDLEEQARQRKAKLQALKARRDESSNVRFCIGTHFANSQNYRKTIAIQ